MNRTRMLWWAGTAVLALLLAAACWFLALSPLLDDASSAGDEAERTELSNETRRLEMARLAADRENQHALEAELAALRQQFPTTLELESFVQHLAALSGRSGAVVQSVSRSEPAPSDAGGAGRVYQVSVNLSVEGTYDQQLQYLSDLQDMDDRLFLVTAASNLGAESMDIAGYTFVLVDADQVQSAPEGDTAVTTGADAGADQP
jgi:Tfp pilus assembly protein PilO